MIRNLIIKWANRTIASRKPDFIIGEPSRPYIQRWFVIPKNRLFTLYLHRTSRSDDDRGLHSHPSFNMSYVVDGGYTEHTIAAGGVHYRKWRGPGSFVFRWAKSYHRLELPFGHNGAIADLKPSISIFVMGPRYRVWDFACPEKGLVPWYEFVASPDADSPLKGQVGRGCD